MIIKCSCKHPYQDKRYGNQMRVMNKMKSPTPGKRQEYRCAVCSKVHEKGE